MIFKDPPLNSFTLQAWKIIFNSMTFQVFHVLYKPCDIKTTTLYVPALPWQLSLVTFPSETHTCFSKKSNNNYYFFKFNNQHVDVVIMIIVKRGKGAQDPKAQTDRTYPGFFIMKHASEYCYSPLDGMLVYHRVTLPAVSHQCP